MKAPPGSRYVYCYMRTADVPAEMDGGVGGATVRPVAAGTVAALVSEVGGVGFAPGRASLSAHAEVLRRALDSGPVLPLRFGVVLAGEELVRADIAACEQELAQLLDGLQDRLEMTLQALYALPQGGRAPRGHCRESRRRASAPGDRYASRRGNALTAHAAGAFS